MKILRCDTTTLEKFSKLISRSIEVFGMKTMNQVLESIALRLESNEYNIIKETFNFTFDYELRRVLNKNLYY